MWLKKEGGETQCSKNYENYSIFLSLATCKCMYIVHLNECRVQRISVGFAIKILKFGTLITLTHTFKLLSVKLFKLKL